MRASWGAGEHGGGAHGLVFKQPSMITNHDEWHNVCSQRTVGIVETLNILHVKTDDNIKKH